MENGENKRTVKNVDIKREICIEKNQESEKKNQKWGTTPDLKIVNTINNVTQVNLKKRF